MSTADDTRKTFVATGGEPESATPRRPLVVFLLDEQRYALALSQVLRCIRVVAITPLPDAPAIAMGIVDIGGLVVPVINIRERFEHQARDVRLSDQFLVATTGRRTVALLVDATTGVIEASPESLAAADEILPGSKLVDGAMRLPDGLILIHDLERLLSLEEDTAIGRALGAAAGRDAAPGGNGEGESGASK